MLQPYYGSKKEPTIDTHIKMDTNLKSILLNEINQAQKDIYCVILFNWHFEIK